MKTTLLIMAAGLGSRFGGGIKQLAPVDTYGHIIMDYSIHDAIEAGFNKIVFIIRKDIESDFREVIGNRIETICSQLNVEVGYVFQALDDLPEGIEVPEGRQKPWGTGQAVLAARELIHEPFVVINADDYYGKEAFVKIHGFLNSEAEENHFCMAGFVLKNTLSEHGGVTRGICQMDTEGYLTDVVETHNIVKITEGDVIRTAADGTAIDVNSDVSMNMWGFTPDFMKTLESGFQEFHRTAVKAAPLKAEYLLPIYVGQLVREKRVSVKVLESKDRWFGITYKDDTEYVMQNFDQMIEDGIYNEDLFGDLT